MIYPAEKIWDHDRQRRNRKLERAASAMGGTLRDKVVSSEMAVQLLESVIEPGDRVCLEGNNQKQADFLAQELTRVDPAKVNKLHMLQSVLALPEHLDLYESGIAEQVDFSFSGPQGGRLARMVGKGQIRIGAIHTYLELFSRYFIDLTPHVALVAAQSADAQGNLYTGPNTEDTPAIIEATAFKNGIVIAQVNEMVDKVPRVDIPGDWVNFVIPSPRPHYIEPLFTRDPAQISEIQVLMAMMAIKGIYAGYGVQRLNHGIGFDTAAIELLLPTYAESLGLKGKICSHWALNPHPAMIPAIEAGFVKSIHSFGKLHCRASRRVFHRAGWHDALEPRVLAGGRTLCLRHVHRVDLADRYGRQQLDRDAGSHLRLRRCVQHGRGCRRAAPRQPGLA